MDEGGVGLEQRKHGLEESYGWWHGVAGRRWQVCCDRGKVCKDGVAPRTFSSFLAGRCGVLRFGQDGLRLEWGSGCQGVSHWWRVGRMWRVQGNCGELSAMELSYVLLHCSGWVEQC